MVTSDFTDATRLATPTGARSSRSPMTLDKAFAFIEITNAELTRHLKDG